MLGYVPRESHISIIISRLEGFINRLRPIECKLSNKTGKSCRSFRITPLLLFFFPSILLFFISILFLFPFVSLYNIHSCLPLLIFLYFSLCFLYFFFFLFMFLCLCFLIFSFILHLLFSSFLSSVYFLFLFLFIVN